MDILLDTHILLWTISDPDLIPEHLRSMIKSSGNKCCVSVASLWEIAIKYSIGRLEIKGGIDNFFDSIFQTGFEIIPISVNHVSIIATLPLHHKDPFDRILIVQAKVESMAIITKDTWFKNYDVEVIW